MTNFIRSKKNFVLPQVGMGDGGEIGAPGLYCESNQV